MPELILASSSPRRADLLSQIGLEFEVVVPEVSETVQKKELPADYVARISRKKADSVAAFLEQDTGAQIADRIILAADTAVVVDGAILGKPSDRSDAISMLQRLSGSTHQVITSVTVRLGSRVESAQVEPIVQFRVIRPEECVRYWVSGEPADKAGAYGIQGLGSIFVEKLCGSYSNVVGLPLAETASLLSGFGLDCLPLEPPSEPRPAEEQNLDKDVIQHG